MTVALPGLTRVNSSGNNLGTMTSWKVLLLSDTSLLSYTEMLNLTSFCPAGIITGYGPGL